MKNLVYNTKTKSFSEKQFVLIWHEVGPGNGDMITHCKSVSSKEEAAEFINKTDCEGGELFDDIKLADKAYRLAQRGDKGDENARDEYTKLMDKSIATFSDQNPTPNQEGADYELKNWIEQHPGQAKYIAELGAKWGVDNILEGLEHDMNK